ncbi:conserved hypothetical protein [Ruegeria lacuscaerulensis ITI-1157]|nr:conserved hypothetical protein [Ruegeria lacuscaerulensis ITI-1157]SHJ09843.1 hypothetical protein SAMN05444404_1419 [Ruegeria lacuscaerulensis ITI-1157]
MEKDDPVTATRTYHGGLQFDGDTEGAVERFGNIVAATLNDYGHLVERKALLNPTEASIVSNQYLIRLKIECEASEPGDRFMRLDQSAGLRTLTQTAASRPRNRLSISVAPVSDLLDDKEISELMLVVMLYRMVDICSTQRVEWLSPHTVLTVEQFMSAFDSLKPLRARDRRAAFEAVSGPFAGLQVVEDEEVSPVAPTTASNVGRPIQLTDDQLLSIAFRSESEQAPSDGQVSSEESGADAQADRPSDALRLASWVLTGAVATISAPIALSLTAVNLIRGEDFRLNTQVLAYTVAIVSLSSSGAFAGAASALGL